MIAPLQNMSGWLLGFAGTRRALILMACAAAALFGITRPAIAGAASAETKYPAMSPVETYLMDRTEEIALARSAAPASISKDATILVLSRHGYEIAVKGSNGFVCLVERGWVGAFDWPERWNAKIRGADCLNPPAARSVLPLAEFRTNAFLAGRSTADVIDAMKTALRTRQLPTLEPGAMSYMMSKSSYLTDEDDHDMAHLMFYVPLEDNAAWGAGAAGSPVDGGPYWFVAPHATNDRHGLPPMSIFIVEVRTWSDGTPSSMHRM